MFCIENTLAALPLVPDPEVFAQPTLLTKPNKRLLETVKKLLARG
ncbi:MAG: hypothetical protein ACK41E_10415 [Deinococcales bacterium]